MTGKGQTEKKKRGLLNRGSGPRAAFLEWGREGSDKERKKKRRGKHLQRSRNSGNQALTASPQVKTGARRARALKGQKPGRGEGSHCHHHREQNFTSGELMGGPQSGAERNNERQLTGAGWHKGSSQAGNSTRERLKRRKR